MSVRFGMKSDSLAAIEREWAPAVGYAPAMFRMAPAACRSLAVRLRPSAPSSGL